MLLDFNDDSKTRPIYANIEIIVLQHLCRWSEKSFAFALSRRYYSHFDNKFVSWKQFLYRGIRWKTWNVVGSMSKNAKVLQLRISVYRQLPALQLILCGSLYFQFTRVTVKGHLVAANSSIDKNLK